MKKDLVQVRNPRSGKWVKINTQTGQIIGCKKSLGPYKNIQIRGDENVYKSK